MSRKRNSISDLRGAGRLAVDAVNGVLDIVEAMHYNITSFGGLVGNRKKPRTSGITAMVYRNIRSATGLAAKSFDGLMNKLAIISNEKEPSPEQEAILAALNGVIGDHLEETKNPLAIPMRLRRNGKATTAINQSIDKKPIQKIVLLIHGSCMNDLQWERQGHNHGVALQRDFGYLPIYLHYNSGRHISENGKELTNLLEATIYKLPVKAELIILAHSMGGLIARSAIHYGKEQKHQWLLGLQKLIFLGAPHHGAPLEQTGNWIDTMLETSRYSAPISKLGKLRSAGITDLRFGNILDSDWEKHDRFKPVGDVRTPVPLPSEVRCYTIAATIGSASTKLGDDLIGDGLVPLYSALGHHENPAYTLSFLKEHQRIFRKMKHLDLLDHPDVYAIIQEWLQPE